MFFLPILNYFVLTTAFAVEAKPDSYHKDLSGFRQKSGLFAL